MKRRSFLSNGVVVSCLVALAFSHLSGCAEGESGGFDDTLGGGPRGTSGDQSTGAGAAANNGSPGAGGATTTGAVSSVSSGVGGNGGGSSNASSAASTASAASSTAASSSATASSSAGTGGGMQNNPPRDFDQFQERNLQDINQYRATLNIAPLVLDKELSTFALGGSQELTMDHVPHQHFKNAGNNGTLWTSGFKSSAGENQGDPNGWFPLAQDPAQNEMTQIDAIQKAMFDEGPGPGEAHGHYENMMNANFTRLGVGLIEISGKLYLTNDFSN